MRDDGLFTDAWLASCNDALAAAPALEEGRGPLVVTELIPDAPEGAHGVVTLVADEDGVRLVAGEDPRATAWLTVSMADAEALHDGALEPAAALTEGRVRVRGDLRAVTKAVDALAGAHTRLRER